MATVIISPNMVVANPPGFININVLPTLPSGLTRAHLMRASLDIVRRNLIDGELTAIEEFGSPFEGVYGDISVQSPFVPQGWRDPGADQNFTSGFTWLSVGRRLQGEASGERLPYVGTMNYSNSPNTGRGYSLNVRSDRIEFVGQFRGEFVGRADYSTTPSREDFFAVFGAVNFGNNNISGHIPHEDVFGDATYTPGSGWSKAEAEGLGLSGRGGDGGSNATPTDQAFFAEWGRALSRAEMLSAYAALKPWLAERGVSIL
jgi:hypothetical protein